MVSRTPQRIRFPLQVEASGEIGGGYYIHDANGRRVATDEQYYPSILEGFEWGEIIAEALNYYHHRGFLPQHLLDAPESIA